MNMSRAQVIPVGLLAALLVGVVLWRSQRGSAERPATADAERTAQAGDPSMDPARRGAARPGKGAPSVDAALQAVLAGAPGGRTAAVRELREALARLPAPEAVRFLRATLDAKVDAPTGEGFELGRGGRLSGAPTLRVLLLEQLSSLDPAAAEGSAREILGSTTSPEEWAVALQALGRGEPEPGRREFMREKMRELLRHEPWQQNASVAYLQSFDVAVQLGGTELLGPLTDLVRRQDNRAVAHAAFLALDRLVIQQPGDTLAALAARPESMAGREQTRANYFARADVGDPAQRALVEGYLLDPSRPGAELQAFAGLFPSANYMISHNLLTAHPTPTGSELARRDRAALEVVDAWLADPRFAAQRPLLETIRERLRGFVR
jgi:hypothetical protein